MAELNSVLDEMPLETMQPGDWWGRVHGHSYGGHWEDGLNLQQIYEAGEPFERLLGAENWSPFLESRFHIAKTAIILPRQARDKRRKRLSGKGVPGTDHPSYVGKVRHFLGGEGTFDYAQGELFIDENFASIRGTFYLV